MGRYWLNIFMQMEEPYEFFPVSKSVHNETPIRELAASISTSKIPIAIIINTGNLFLTTNLTFGHVDHLILCSYMLREAWLQIEIQAIRC